MDVVGGKPRGLAVWIGLTAAVAVALTALPVMVVLALEGEAGAAILPVVIGTATGLAGGVVVARWLAAMAGACLGEAVECLGALGTQNFGAQNFGTSSFPAEAAPYRGPVRVRIAEVAALAAAVDRLGSQLADYAKSVEIGRTKLRTLVDLCIEMTREKRQDRILELIVDGAKRLTLADGATLYTRVAEDTLRFEVAKNTSLDIAMGIGGDTSRRLPDLKLWNAETGVPNRASVVSCAVLDGRTISVSDIYSSTEYDFAGARGFDERMGYRTVSLLTVPLKPFGGDITGALQLINATDPVTGAVVPFDQEVVGFVEALAAQAAVTMENKALADAHRNLMDALVQLIAQAIDAKSPYTAGHCARVPEVALMLARAAAAATDGPFREFNFREEEWREFYLAAWLHDCGKVTTPEYVVDKATKLETIHNRIHEIRTRFEVAKRDRIIRCLEERIRGERPEAELERERDADLAALDEDFAFVAECNVGGEFMAPEKVGRLKRIAERTWVRTLDDRLGLSHDEMRRRPAEAPKLPVLEHLLADKAEHIIAHDNPEAMDPLRKRFTLRIPDQKFNLGEIYNLSIARGTLTDEDRFHINNHVVQTILMLEALPFPKDLKRVAEWAGGHHEKLDGKGYPSSLDRNNLSMPARLLALADIFEALTASDRPYKKPKTLSESFKIMSFMVKDQHIDPEVFELFMASGVWDEYARKYLKPSQIDSVRIDDYLPVKAA
jgi:HD-GYP domain-containing protein (c-di-GMP phosphodiesterase class II)